MKRLSRIFFIYTFFLVSSVASTISDDKIGFSLTLPNNWVVLTKNDTSMSFMDTTGKYQAAVGISFEDLTDKTVFATPDEWTRAHFVSYEIVTNANPVAALILADTVSIKQNGLYWAAETYAYFYEYDSTAVGEYAEYIRYVAVGKSGYELYAIGTIPDLDSNIAYYSKLIDDFQIRGANAPVIQPSAKRHLPRVYLSEPSHGRLNLLGRRFGSGPDNSPAPQLIISQRRKSCHLK